MRKILALLLLIIFCRNPAGAQALLPIDSIYLNALPQFSKNIARITNDVWPGMTIGPYAIFRIGGPVFLKNHPQPPAGSKALKDSVYQFKQSEIALLGTSQTEINHFLTAHNNYAQPQYISINQFYSELFHELHHVYQRAVIKTVQFDNPAELLTYPENYLNDAIRQYEDEILLAMLQGPAGQFQENLNLFYSSRVIRQALIGKSLLYEEDVESCEGPATYCEYRYMQAFGTTVQEQQYTQKRFFEMLIEPTYGRDGLRNKRLLSGMVLCLILDKHFKNWQQEYYKSNRRLSDFFFSKFTPQLQVKLPKLDVYIARAKYFTAIEKEKHSTNQQAFNSQGGFKITILFKTSPEFRGFDPMHAEAVNDSLILHPTLLKLAKKDNYFTAANERVETLVKGSVWNVESVTFFAPESQISLENNTLKYNGAHIQVNWHYTTRVKTGNEYLITVE